MNNKVLIAVVVLVVLLFSGWMLLRNSSNTDNSGVLPTQDSTQPMVSNSPETTPAESSAGASVSNATVKEFTVTGSSFKFDPATLQVNQGDKVRITFKSGGGTHDFVIDEYDIKTNILPSGGQEVVEFTADKPGTFKYYCSVGNHRAMGMEGTLTVK